MNKLLLLAFLGIFCKASFSQEINELQPLPLKEIAHIYAGISSVEITFYESSKTISIQENTNCKFLPASTDTIPPFKLNPKKIAYLMVMVDEDFYIEAELSYQENNAYLIYKKNEILYYNQLNEVGYRYFSQLLKSL